MKSSRRTPGSGSGTVVATSSRATRAAVAPRDARLPKDALRLAHCSSGLGAAVSPIPCGSRSHLPVRDGRCSTVAGMVNPFGSGPAGELLGFHR